MKFKGIIFDMDGTVLDTEPMSFVAWSTVLKEKGYPVTKELLHAHIGMNQESTAKLMRAEFGDNFDYYAIRGIVTAFRLDYIEKNGLVIKKGYAELMNFIKANSLKAVIATSTPHEEAISHLKRAGIYGDFNALIGGDQIQNGKPAPDIFLKAAELIGLPPADCLVLEDSENGLKAAFAAGISAVLVPDMKIPSDEVKGRVFAEVESLDRVIEILK